MPPLPLALPFPWQGWQLDPQGVLLDPAGNRYLPSDIQASWYARQAWQARAGSPGELRYLKAQLLAEVAFVRRPLIITVARLSPAGLSLPLGSLVVSPWLSGPHCLAWAGQGAFEPVQAAPLPLALSVAA